MIIFKCKTPESTVIHRLNEDLTWTEVVDEFVHFLQGCGYIVSGSDVASYLMDQYEFQLADDSIPLEEVVKKLKSKRKK